MTVLAAIAAELDADILHAFIEVGLDALVQLVVGRAVGMTVYRHALADFAAP